MRLLFRLYVIAALVAAGILAPLVYAPVPWLMLLAYLYLSFTAEGSPSQKERTQLKVPFNMALALSLPLFFQPLLGTWLSPVLALPVLPLLDHSLRQFASGYEFDALRMTLPGRRRPTKLARSLALSLMLVALVALALAGWSLLISTALVAAYLAGLVLPLLLRSFPAKGPVAAEVVKQRIVAGDFLQTTVRLINGGNLAGHLGLLSPYPWFSVRPGRIVLNKTSFEIETSLTPPLAGPARVEL